MPSFCFSLVLWNPSSIGSPIRGNPISTASPFLGRCLYGVHHSLYILLRSYVDVVGSLSINSSACFNKHSTDSSYLCSFTYASHVDASVCGIPSRTFSLLLCFYRPVDSFKVKDLFCLALRGTADCPKLAEMKEE
ncbi:hypothetical protein M432DRAFT_467437 [Thermoascus aurantiacus ATCC 26904]